MCICVKFAHRDVCRIVNNINLSDCQFSVTRPYTDIILPLSECQWSFRGGTRGNAVPIVKIPLERMGTALPLLSYGENAYILHKMHFAVQKYVFLTLKYGKTRWRPGLHPGPRWGSSRLSPDPLFGWERDFYAPHHKHHCHSTEQSVLCRFIVSLLIRSRSVTEHTTDDQCLRYHDNKISVA